MSCPFSTVSIARQQLSESYCSMSVVMTMTMSIMMMMMTCELLLVVLTRTVYYTVLGDCD